jgi:hypothetical protein
MTIAFNIILSAYAGPHHSPPPFTPSDFTVTPINSPVKGSTAKFRINLPQGFKVESIKVKIISVKDLKMDQGQTMTAELVENSELHIPVSSLPPGFYRLHISLKDKSTKKDHAFKTHFHDFVRFVIDDSLQVPIPDKKKNNSTLGGIDSDNDGIRDDIQRYINENFSNRPSTRLALRQLAMSQQNKLLNITDRESALYHAGVLAEALTCLAWIDSKNIKLSRDLEALYKNTEMRIKASLRHDQLFHGGGLPESIHAFDRTGSSDSSVFCSFDNPIRGQ